MTAPAFEATPVQNRLMDAITDGRYRLIGFGGGVRGSKTFGSLAALLTLCRIYPHSRWAVIRKDLQRLRDTTIPTFDKLRLAHLGGDTFVSGVNQQTWNATCRNGSEILFRGENIDKDPELLRFHGYEVNGFLNEEADELSERTLVKEIERAGTWIIPGGGPQPIPYILNTFNPCAGWPRRRFYVPWKAGTLAPPYAFIPTTQADNPFITDAQREAWRDLPENEYRRFILGDWDAMTGAYYDTLSTDHLIDRAALPTPLPAHWRYWGSYDWGYGHWAVMMFWVTDTDGMDYLLDTMWLRKGQDDEYAAEYLRETDPAQGGTLPRACLSLVYAGWDCWHKPTAHGAKGESTAEVFARVRIALTRADIDLINGGRAVNRQLKARRVRIVKTKGNVRVFDQLGEIVPDENDIRKPGKVDADADGVGGDDGADAFRYGLATRVPAAKVPAGDAVKVPDRAPLWTVTADGKLEVRAPQPADTLAKALGDSGRGSNRRLPHRKYR